MLRNPNYLPGFVELLCDNCGNSFLKHKNKSIIKREIHYCQRNCIPKEGVKSFIKKWDGTTFSEM